MYDTVNLWLNHSDYFDAGKCLNLLADQREITDQTGTKFSGNFDNFRITVKETGIFFSGSLAKLYFGGENQSTLTRAATKGAMQMLEDNLELPISKADVCRIDFSTNIPVKHKEGVYYAYLGNARFYKRNEASSGLYYQNKQRTLLFYSKIIEQTAKKTPILQMYVGKNLLRYEMRFTKRLKKQLNVPLINGQTLYEPDFYQNLIKRWEKEYLNIHRNKNLIENKMPTAAILSNKKDFEKYLMQLGMQLIGGEMEALQMIDRAKDMELFTNKMQPNRLKALIKDVSNFEAGATENDAIQELDKKIKQIAKYQL